MSSGVTPMCRPPITIDGLNETVVVMPNRFASLAMFLVPTSRPTREKTLLSETASASDSGILEL